MKKTTIFIFLVCVLGIFCIPAYTQAQDTAKDGKEAAQGAVGSEMKRQLDVFGSSAGVGTTADVADPRMIVGRIVRVVVSLLMTMFVLYTIYGGYLIFTSAGEEEKMSKGRKVIFQSTIGVFIILSSYSITWLAFFIVYKGHQNPFGQRYAWWGIEPDTSQYYQTDPLEQSTVPENFNLFQ